MQESNVLRLPAPAKLNLMLRIVGRRPDGYHLLQTVFQFVDHCDWICLTPRSDGRIILRNPLPGVPPEVDLTVRAARALQSVAGLSFGVEIAIEKHLPMGGGLGGGSSDCATTLAGLNRLWGAGLGLQDLMALGIKLGADVPVFLFGRSAWGEGVGEELSPVELPEPWYVVLKPACHVVTGEIFASPDLTRDSNPITIADFLAGQQGNDCLPAVISRYPEIAGALRELSEYSPARLTGTGACVFAAFDQEAVAREVAAVLAKRWAVFVARGQNVSALQRALGLA